MSQCRKFLSATVSAPLALLCALALAPTAWADPPDASDDSTAAAPPVELSVTTALQLCVTCHGVAGHSKDDKFPNLAAQQPNYFIKQVKSFRDRTRADPHAKEFMFSVADRLDDVTVAALAKYFAAQKPAAKVVGDANAMAHGKDLYMNGRPGREIPACQTCHGEKGEGNDILPRLASQHPVYLEEQLVHFQTGARAHDYMHDNAINLSRDEIHDIAAYLAAQ
jgi:cytochrome c553